MALIFGWKTSPKQIFTKVHDDCTIVTTITAMLFKY